MKQRLARSLALVAAAATGALAAPPAPWPDGPVPGAPNLIVTSKADVAFCGGRAVAVRAHGSARGVEPELIAALTLAPPGGLDFATPDAKAASTQKFETWLISSKKTAEAALALYGKRIADPHATAAEKVVAAARVAQAERRLADVVTRMAIPSAAEPVYDRAAAAAAVCRKLAAAGNVGAGWWTQACAP